MSSKSTRILLIEDNQPDVVLVRTALENASMQYDLYTADSLGGAREVIEQRQIDIILLDLGLPDASGFNTLTKVLQRHPDLPVVILTSTNNEIVGNQAVKAGAEDYLVKGQFDGKQLGRSIRYALQRFEGKQRAEQDAIQYKKDHQNLEIVHEMSKFGNWNMDLITRKMFWTDPIYKAFGFQPNSFEPSLSDYLRYVDNEDRNAVEAFFEELPNKVGTQSIEHRIVIEGRKVRHLNVTARIQQDPVTQQILLVGGLQDVSERKIQEQQIVEELMSRKASVLKDELLTDMSFHIRTPLSSVVQLSYLISQSQLNLQQRELVDDLRTAIDDLSITFSNLLNFSLLISDNSAPSTELFYLQDLLQSVTQIANIRANANGVQFGFPINDDLPERIVADQKKITQVLYNLIEFGLDRNAHGLVCSLAVSIQHLGNKEQTALSLKLTTNADSIATSKIKELLSSSTLIEQFKNDNNPESKRYMPLAIIAMLADRLGGRFDVQSRGNHKGNIVEVLLPIEIVVKADPQMAAQQLKKPMRILMVEDHYLNQIATRKILTGWSDLISVDIAENGLIGVEKFRANEYDLILMDIQMPIMNGFEATSRIREQNKEIPIIALTANASRQEADKCRERGLNEYISKPFKPQDLFEKILLFV